jgi:hypothetical protein
VADDLMASPREVNRVELKGAEPLNECKH